MDAADCTDFRCLLLRMGVPLGYRPGFNVEARATAPPASVQNVTERAALSATQPLYFLLSVSNMGHNFRATQGAA